LDQLFGKRSELHPHHREHVETPIKDFELAIEKSAPEDYVSFCWDGKVEKPDNRTLVAKVRNFVPKRELKVTFFQVRK
jgi:hypothetical protein